MRADHVLIAVLLAGVIGTSEATPRPAAAALPIEGTLPPFDGATGWFNSPALTPPALRGKVVVVEFWTYSCINWLRTLPYVRAWAKTYGDHGLAVIGVHSPEFPFEHDVENVRAAAQRLQIGYPIAIDNDFAVWRAFGNTYWPALYFIDAQGRIRHHQFGEGDYAHAEAVIRQLLVEAGHHDAARLRAVIDARGAEAPADWNDVQSGEAYLGSARAENFASPGGAHVEKAAAYTVPRRLSLNAWALAGTWTVRKDAVELHAAPGRIAYRFHARDLHLVLGLAAHRRAVRFRVLIDGQPPGSAHGEDVDRDGYGSVSAPRLYQLIRQAGPIADRRFEIEFLDAGVDAYVFTFG